MRPPSPSWAAWSAAVVLFSPAAAFLPPRPRQAGTSFDWSAITPTAHLQYHACYGGTFQCARLQVPLDWSKANSSSSLHAIKGPIAAIALVTLPATVPPTDPAYAGPILVNPGGPGGPGTQMALSLGATIQTLVDVPGERHYDIVGFDPRGTGFSTPSASCYGGEFERKIDALQLEGMPSVVTEAGIQVRFETYKGIGQLCKLQTSTSKGGEDDSIFRHITAASVARDMLEIVERSHQLLVKTGNQVVKASSERPRLQYMGFSYGSILGNVFASMFPGRVGRMVVDGIADAADYISGTWQKMLTDAEDAVDAFYSTCFDAGDACPLRISEDGSVADIRRRVSALIKTLQTSPASVVYNGRVYIISSFTISELIRTATYNPISSYDLLARQLADAFVGNFTTILANSTVFPPDTHAAVCDSAPATSPPQAYTHASDASTGIICSDSQASSPPRNLAWAAEAVSRMLNQSSTVGEGWSRLALGCSDWPFQRPPPYTFRGPFGSPAPIANSSTTPSSPLLILSTRIDPATPLANAFALSRLHGGSAVVVQESVGHCALLSAVSQCSYAIVREYFRSGKVPANGTVCKPDCVPEIPYKQCPGLP